MMVNRRAMLAGIVVAGANFEAGAALSEPMIEQTTLRHGDGRLTRYRVMAPSRGGVWPVVLFSHGANSSNADYDALWRAWAERGYLVIGANHIDTGPPAAQPKIGKSALFRARVADMLAPLSQRALFEAFAARTGATPHWTNFCAAGHSFGAVIAQAIAGAKLFDPGDHTPFDGRTLGVAACMTFSPPGPLPGYIPADAWAPITAPSLLQTGDADVLPGFVNDWRLRLTGFAGAPDRWAIVGRGVDHYFGGLICRRVPGADADLPALRETARLSADFLDAYLQPSPAGLKTLGARAALGDDGVLTFAAA